MIQDKRIKSNKDHFQRHFISCLPLPSIFKSSISKIRVAPLGTESSGGLSPYALS